MSNNQKKKGGELADPPALTSLCMQLLCLIEPSHHKSVGNTFPLLRYDRYTLQVPRRNDRDRRKWYIQAFTATICLFHLYLRTESRLIAEPEVPAPSQPYHYISYLNAKLSQPS
jgi:hypothetical protein